MVAVVLVLAGIAIHVFGASTSNGIVSALNDAAKWLVQPFKNVFRIHNAKANVAANWGLALVVYAIVGGLLARAMARSAIAARARRPWRRRAVV